MFKRAFLTVLFLLAASCTESGPSSECSTLECDDAGHGDDTFDVGDDDVAGDDDVTGDDDVAGGDDDLTPEPRPEGFGELDGVVHFRLFDNTRLPVAKPFVYWTLPESPPAPLTTGRSCDCGYPAHAHEGADNGGFVLTDVPAGPVYLVVQKGQFRSYRLVDVVANERVHVPRELTELPVRNDPVTGDQIPSLALGTGRFDAIEDLFAKLRLGPITSTFGFDYEEYMADPGAYGVELFLYQQPRRMEDNDLALVAEGFPELLQDPARLAEFNFVFAPCAEYQTYGTLMTSAPTRAAIRDYVNNGGNLYVTDYAYDVVEQVFPAYIDFAAPDGADGNADDNVGDLSFMGVAASGTLRYESDNRAHPEDLVSWMASAGASDDGTLLTEGNWVNLNGVGTVTQCCDRDGNTVDVTPDVVMSGPNGVDPFFGEFGPSHDDWDAAEAEGANFPHTLSFAFGCGDVMYSTYHTVESIQTRADIAPQEMVLLYLILELNQCNLNPIKEDDVLR